MPRKKFISLISLLTFTQTLASCEPVDIASSSSNMVSNITDSSNNSSTAETSSSSNSLNEKYRVTFYHPDGTKLFTTTSNENGKVTYSLEEPTKKEHDKVFKFDGWIIDGGDGTIYSSNELPSIKKDTAFIAHFSEVINSYTIRFERDDGTLIEERTFEQGKIPSPSIATPTKPSTEAYDYKFSRWNKTFTKVSENTTYVAIFTEIIKQYEITFLNGDGSKLASFKYDYGTFGLTSKEEILNLRPVKNENVQASYTFSNQWKNRDVDGLILDDNTVLRKNETYIPIFETKKKTYQITFKDNFNTVLDTRTYEYGAIPSFENPTKASTTQYEYRFTGWDKIFSMVTGNDTYIANFERKTRKYLIRYLNYDGSVLYSEEVEYNNPTSYKSSVIPSKPSTNTENFTFTNNWQNNVTKEIGLKNVTGPVDYVPVFDNGTTRYYTVTFYDEDGTTILDKKTFTYNADLKSAVSNPTKASTKEFDYTFLKWDRELTNVTSDTSYRATFKAIKRKYNITFKYDDDSTYKVVSVEYGLIPSIADPSKAQDERNTYTFIGWDKPLSKVDGETTYVAKFEPTKRQYTVTFVNDDNSEISTRKYYYGDTVTIPQSPSKKGDASTTYTFAGWDKKVTTVTGDVTYKATYTSTTNTYTIKFIDGDGKELSSRNYDYNSTLTYVGETPTKTSTAQYSYKFKGWSKTPNGIVLSTLEKVTTNQTYYAVFDSITRSYNIQFIVEGSTVQNTTFAYNTIPSYNGTTPKKASTAQYDYTFAGWSKTLNGSVLSTLDKVTGSQTYYAQFTSKVRSYQVTFKDDTGATLSSNQTVSYGSKVTMNAILTNPTKADDNYYKYTFSNWKDDKSPANTIIYGTTEFVAIFTKISKTAVITYLDDSGNEIDRVPYQIGSTITNPPTATKANSLDNHYSYKFKGWSKTLNGTVLSALDKVTGNQTYYAVFEEVENSFTVKFIDNYGKEIFTSQTVLWGKTISMNSSYLKPTKASTVSTDYTFVSWDKDLSSTVIKGNTTFTAEFIESTRRYTITFKNYDNSYLWSSTFEYGSTPEYLGRSFEKPCDDPYYYYEFLGWTPALSKVTGEATYVARYSDKIKRKGSIKFIIDGKETVIHDVEYGTVLSTLIPFFDKEKTTSDPDYEYYSYLGMYIPLGGGQFSTKDLTTDKETVMDSSGMYTYQAVWKLNKREYVIRFTSDENSETKLTGSDDYEQILNFYDYIKKPDEEPYVADKYGIVTNDIIGWRIVYTVEGSSTKQYHDIESFSKDNIKALKPYFDQNSDQYNLRIVPKWQIKPTNYYEAFEDDGEGIELGSYPQTIANSNVTTMIKTYINTGNSSSGVDYDNNTGYYTISGHKYLRMDYTGKTTTFRSSDYQRSITLTNGETYFFEVEPIIWRRRRDENLTGGKTMLIASKILDYTTYFDYSKLKFKTEEELDAYMSKYEENTSTESLSNYKESYLRKFLNNEFYNRAFKTDSRGQAQVVKTSIDNSPKSMGLDSYTNTNTSNIYMFGDLSSTDDYFFPLSTMESYKFNNTGYTWQLNTSYDKDYTPSNSYENSKYFKYSATDYALANLLNTYKGSISNSSNSLRYSYYLRSQTVAGATEIGNNFGTIAVAGSYFNCIGDPNLDKYKGDKVYDSWSILDEKDTNGYIQFDLSGVVNGVLPAFYCKTNFWSTKW